MEILFLGTGAADWPKEAGALADERAVFRRRTSILIDGCILIDPNPDVPEALAAYGANPDNIRWVLISHSHDDHFSADTLRFLADTHPIDVFGDGGYPDKLPVHEGITFHAMERRRPVELPFGTLTAVLSTHVVEDTDEFCLHYIIEREGKTLFYGPDGAWFGGGTWYEMEKHRFDCVILDATFGDDLTKTGFRSRRIWFYHNSASMIKTIREAFLDRKIADAQTLFIADHVSRSFYPDIETARAVFEPMGYLAAYDGLRLTL